MVRTTVSSRRFQPVPELNVVEVVCGAALKTCKVILHQTYPHINSHSNHINVSAYIFSAYDETLFVRTFSKSDDWSSG